MERSREPEREGREAEIWKEGEKENGGMERQTHRQTG